MKLTGRDKKEKDDLDKLIELRKNYLDKKGKKPTPKNIKVEKGFTEVLDAATGFMCIKKEVFHKMNSKR